MKDYLTISEFAKRANITNQAVYQRIGKDLSEYVRVIDNKKYIDIKALDKFINKKCTRKQSDIDFEDFESNYNPFVDLECVMEFGDNDFDDYIPDCDYYSVEYMISDDIKKIGDDILTGQKEILSLLIKKGEYIEILQQNSRESREKELVQSDKLFLLLQQSNDLLGNNQLILTRLLNQKENTLKGLVIKIRNKINAAICDKLKI